MAGLGGAVVGKRDQQWYGDLALSPIMGTLAGAYVYGMLNLLPVWRK
jgi:hypothetical protein